MSANQRPIGRCQARSSGGHRCSLQAGHETRENDPQELHDCGYSFRTPSVACVGSPRSTLIAAIAALHDLPCIETRMSERRLDWSEPSLESFLKR